MSLCFFNPFINSKFDNNKGSVNVSVTDYKDFLVGRIWDKKMLAIDFENITKHFDNYINSYLWTQENGSSNSYNGSTLPNTVKKPYLSYVGQMYGNIVKCYAINIPTNTTLFMLTISTDVFPDGIRPI